MTAGVRVFAFEPESQNYALLNKNIFANGLQQQVTAYAAALSDETGFSDLHLSTLLIGGSCHSYGEAVDFHLQPRDTGLRQGCYSTTIDALVGSGVMPCPTHIKIDVDGNEHKVIAGAERTLDDERVRSVLVELNTNLAQHRDIIESLEGRGFNLHHQKLTQSIRQEGAFTGVGNHIFERR
ncbi:MAG: FkbM family methyltransferase [Rhodospirillaceae bacterium]